jgi:hypothetical protein
MESIADMVDVVGVYASNGDPAIWWHIDGELFLKSSDHISFDTSEGEHANLLCNV